MGACATTLGVRGTEGVRAVFGFGFAAGFGARAFLLAARFCAAALRAGDGDEAGPFNVSHRKRHFLEVGLTGAVAGDGSGWRLGPGSG